MSARRELVYKLDEDMATGREPKELHLVLSNGVSWSSLGATRLFQLRCPQGVSTLELVTDWAEWNRQIDGDEGHSNQELDLESTRRDQAELANRQEYKRSDPSGPCSVPEVDHSGQRAGESLQQRKVQRRDDTLLHRLVGPGASPSENEIWWKHGNSASRVLCDGWIDEAMVARYASKYGRRRWLLTAILNSERRLQISEDCRSEAAHDGRTEERVGEGSRESCI